MNQERVRLRDLKQAKPIRHKQVQLQSNKIQQMEVNLIISNLRRNKINLRKNKKLRADLEVEQKNRIRVDKVSLQKLRKIPLSKIKVVKNFNPYFQQRSNRLVVTQEKTRIRLV